MRLKRRFAFIFLAILTSAWLYSSNESLAAQSFKANGPITNDEIQYFISAMNRSLSDEDDKKCMTREAERIAHKVGDPETLDPTNVDMLPVDKWALLSKHSKRVILTQVIMNQTIFQCL